ncbi:MAG: tRNA (adenosine(37)-N6)-threonylcarbamoyltransferase complex ATPase subunit type 1 TsaE [Alphaproteobacteria bacterium]|nr:tRNA (adenosine(37)-N6)-threonylcarbamoyltransferase complex ATPase subunit type 1 TsaE [Alphaproteobacteria bacterium]
MSVFISHNEQETLQFASEFAKTLKIGDIIALHGTLGVGKTAFTRGVILSLTNAIEVPSPTFTLLQSYETPNFDIYHFDMYRLKSPDEAYEIGIEDAFAEGVSFIEWPDKIKGVLPKKHIDIFFEVKDNCRIITIKENG